MTFIVIEAGTESIVPGDYDNDVTFRIYQKGYAVYAKLQEEQNL